MRISRIPMIHAESTLHRVPVIYKMILSAKPLAIFTFNSNVCIYVFYKEVELVHQMHVFR